MGGLNSMNESREWMNDKYWLDDEELAELEEIKNRSQKLYDKVTSKNKIMDDPTFACIDIAEYIMDRVQDDLDDE